MAILLNPTSNKKLPHLANLYRFVFSVPSILALSTSPRYALNVGHNAGIFKQLRMVWANDVSTSIYFGISDSSYRGTLDEIIRLETVSEVAHTSNTFDVIFENTDSISDPPLGAQQNPYIYLEIDNNDAINPTGAIDLEIIIQAASSRGV